MEHKGEVRHTETLREMRKLKKKVKEIGRTEGNYNK